MYMGCPAHSSSTVFTPRNRKEHSSRLVIARNLPLSDGAQSYLVLPLHDKSKKSIVTVLGKASGNCCFFQPTAEVHVSVYVETPISALQSMTSQKWSTFADDIHRVTFKDAKYLWLLAAVFRGSQWPQNPWPQSYLNLEAAEEQGRKVLRFPSH